MEGGERETRFFFQVCAVVYVINVPGTFPAKASGMNRGHQPFLHEYESAGTGGRGEVLGLSLLLAQDPAKQKLLGGQPTEPKVKEESLAASKRLRNYCCLVWSSRDQSSILSLALNLLSSLQLIPPSVK